MSNLGNNSCNLNLPVWSSDVGQIVDTSLLPVTGIAFGPLPYQLQQANITVGALKCKASRNRFNQTEHIVTLEKEVDNLESQMDTVQNNMEAQLARMISNQEMQYKVLTKQLDFERATRKSEKGKAKPTVQDYI